MNNAIPSLFEQQGYQLHLIILLLLTIFLLPVAATAYLSVRKNDSEVAFITAIFGGIGWVACLFVLLYVLIPYNSKYWHYYTVEADVVSVSNVLTEASGDLTRQPVVVLEGMDRPVVVDDPRAVDLEGKHASFRCTIEWHYQAADTYNCKIVDYTEAEK